MKITEIVSPDYRLARHKGQQNKLAWRAKQRDRFNSEEEVADSGYRHLPKSYINYKPQAMPLVRFGKFRTNSRIGLDAEMRAEMGNATSEAGVSVYRAMPFQTGWLVVQPNTSRAVYDVTDVFAPVLSLAEQLLDYLDHDTPMDIFLIHGHLSSFGKANEYLNIGSDGEYLLNVRQPYQMERLTPEHVFMSERPPFNFIQWINHRYSHRGPKTPGGGIQWLRQEIADTKASMGES